MGDVLNYYRKAHGKYLQLVSTEQAYGVPPEQWMLSRCLAECEVLRVVGVAYVNIPCGNSRRFGDRRFVAVAQLQVERIERRDADDADEAEHASATVAEQANESKLSPGVGNEPTVESAAAPALLCVAANGEASADSPFAVVGDDADAMMEGDAIGQSNESELQRPEAVVVGPQAGEEELFAANADNSMQSNDSLTDAAAAKAFGDGVGESVGAAAGDDSDATAIKQRVTCNEVMEKELAIPKAQALGLPTDGVTNGHASAQDASSSPDVVHFAAEPADNNVSPTMQIQDTSAIETIRGSPSVKGDVVLDISAIETIRGSPSMEGDVVQDASAIDDMRGASPERMDVADASVDEAIDLRVHSSSEEDDGPSSHINNVDYLDALDNSDDDDDDDATVGSVVDDDVDDNDLGDRATSSAQSPKRESRKGGATINNRSAAKRRRTRPGGAIRTRQQRRVAKSKALPDDESIGKYFEIWYQDLGDVEDFLVLHREVQRACELIWEPGNTSKCSAMAILQHIMVRSA